MRIIYWRSKIKRLKVREWENEKMRKKERKKERSELFSNGI